MPGSAAVAIWCDVAPEIREEFDDWHAHEHFPERLSIPGFLRGSRWNSNDGGSACFVLYETADLTVLTSRAYLERLNNPTPWSRKMMPHHLGMVRSLCAVRASFGLALADTLLTLRFSPQPQAADGLIRWLSTDLLPKLPMRRGLVGAQLLQDAASTNAAPTAEQKIRGGDKSADWVLLVNGYGTDAVSRLVAEELNEAALVAHGATSGSIGHIYKLAYTLSTRP